MLTVMFVGFNSLSNANGLKHSIESNATLPSTQTQDELELLAPPGKIETRQDPDEEGWAQKETPLSTINVSVILLMASSCLGYAYLKNKNLQNYRK